MDTNNKSKTKSVVYIALFLAMAIALVGFLVQDSYTRTLHYRGVQGAKAHSWARVTATLFEKEKDTAALEAKAPGLAKRMMETDPRILEIQVLRGMNFLFHTDAAKTGQRVNPEDSQDKQTYDDNTQLKFRLKKKNIKEKYLMRADAETKELTLVEPIMKNKRTAKGIVKLKYRYDDEVSSRFWQVILACVVILALASLVFYRVGRFQWFIALGAVLLFMLVGLYISGGSAGMLNRVALEQKSAHLDHVLTLVRAEAPELLEQYAAGLKKGTVTGFYPEYSEINLTAPGEPAQFVPDEAYQQQQKQQYDKRSRTVSIAFLVMAYLVLAFILAGYAVRTMSALKKHYYAYIYVFPAMVGMIVLVFFPFLYGMAMGFFKITHQTWDFVWFRNFIEILSDFQPLTPGNFYFTLLVTIMWTFINVALHVGIGLIMALILNRPDMKLKKIYRVLLILPWAVPNYITALIWKGMFHKQFGAINAFLQMVGIEGISWFNHFWTAFFANVATNTWLGFPFMMVISLGALQSIPGYLYEAAEVDGASKWHQFRHITLPLLKPALFPAVVLGTIWTFNMFNIIYLVSNGAPNRSTDILITQAYRYAFENFNWGYAAAYSIIIFLILLAYGTFSNRATKATEGVFD